jgi:hypothetical protein
MSRIITKIKKESLTTKLTLIIIGLTAGSALLVPTTYASFHPVTTGEIADGTIRSADISNTAGVASGDILDSEVYSVDIRNGQVGSVDIQDNGITSADLGNVITRVQGSQVNIVGGSSGLASVDCPSGKILTGGGFYTNSFNARVVQSYPLDGNTWFVQASYQGPSDTTAALIGYALCV